ncbi:glycerophosphodiester phosphodiesterase family protein, partial [Enterococcus faecium]
MKRLALAALLALLPLPGQAFDLEAHRGGRGLMPENSLPAFANALSLGVTTLELDTGM